MHKSIGNTYLLSQLEEWGYDPLAFRLLALGVGYRKPLDFTRAGMDAAQNRLVKWRRTIAEACVATGGRMTEPEPDFGVRAGFVNALADDFNTPRAVAAAEMALDLAGSPDIAMRERDVAALVKQSYVDLTVSRKAIEIHLAGADILRQLADVSQAKYAAGRISQQDVLKSVVELPKREVSPSS